VLYQIYPRSFADANGDGIGDLRGVIERLDHVAWLGADGIWLNPITVSPNADWGYDVVDFCAVDPELGTVDDLDALVAAARDRDLAVVLDLVPNHTSSEHPWFVASRSLRESPKRDWYVWADPASDGGPPNNWVSTFLGPAWELDEKTGQYYLHNFLVEQPDLNWWNAAVRAEFERILRFWLDRGVAGFRVDVAHMLVHDQELRDNPLATDGQTQRYNSNHDEVHVLYRRWREVAESYDPPRLLLGETFLPGVPEIVSYYGADDELHLAFDIPFTLSPFDAGALREVVEETEALMPPGSVPCYTLGNHDVNRFTTRWCGDDPEQVRVALLLFFCLRGALVLYYGDELGLPDTRIPSARRLDPIGRDPERTPMHWADESGGGFCPPGVEPWLPLGDLTINVADQRDDPGSVLHLTRDLISLRRAERELRDGAYATLVAGGGLWAWRRGERCVVACNLGDEPATLDNVDGEIAVCTDRARDLDACITPVGCRPGPASKELPTPGACRPTRC